MQLGGIPCILQATQRRSSVARGREHLQVRLEEEAVHNHRAVVLPGVHQPHEEAELHRIVERQPAGRVTCSAADHRHTRTQLRAWRAPEEQHAREGVREGEERERDPVREPAVAHARPSGAHAHRIPHTAHRRTGAQDTQTHQRLSSFESFVCNALNDSYAGYASPMRLLYRTAHSPPRATSHTRE